MNKIFYFLMVGLAFASLQVVTAEALPSTGVTEGEIIDFSAELACTDEDTKVSKGKCIGVGGTAKETLRSQAGKDLNAGAKQGFAQEEKGSGKKCAAGEDCEIVDFNAELACTADDMRAACKNMMGGMGKPSTGGMGSSPVR
jgi:hypothetical protein